MLPAVKIVVVGDKGCGKTSLVHRHVTDGSCFLDNCTVEGKEEAEHAGGDDEVGARVGLNFHAVLATTSGSRGSSSASAVGLQHQQQQYKQLIWDTTAEPTYANIVQHYATSVADAVVLAFDATRPAETLAYLTPLVQRLGPHQCAILLGCKADLVVSIEHQHQLQQQLLEATAMTYKQHLVSAKTGNGVASAFNELAEAAMLKRGRVAKQVEVNNNKTAAPGVSRRVSWTKATLSRMRQLKMRLA